MHDLSPELRRLAGVSPGHPALQREQRQITSVRTQLVLGMYLAVATVIAGIGLLVRSNLHRIGPMTLLGGIFLVALAAYASAFRARGARRERTLGQDYLLLLGALAFSAAVVYAEVQFRVFGESWSRHLLLLALWHLGTARLFHSRLVLAVGLTAFAGWLGVEARLGSVFDPMHPLLGTGPRALLCAAVFWAGSLMHRAGSPAALRGFRDVYLQFAVNFGFWGALALGADVSTRWVGAAVLLALAAVVARAGWRERRQSLLLYAVGYSTIGLVWLESLLLRNSGLSSLAGLVTVVAAVLLLLSLRSRLQASGI